MLRSASAQIEVLRDYIDQFSPQIRMLLVMLTVAVMALMGGVITAWFQFLAIPAALGLLVAMVIMRVGYRLWWYYVIFILLGYMFLSRGFAYVGMYPVFVGEIGMGLGILSILLIPLSSRFPAIRFRRFASVPLVLLLLFIGFSVLRTIPYVREYEFDALRDAMLYGYAVYALIVMIILPARTVESLFTLFGRILPYMIFWAPILFIFSRLVAFPFIFPGSNSPLIYSKGSDIGVHLAGAGAYMMLQLDQHKRPWSNTMRWVAWGVWAAGVLAFGAFGRAVIVAVLASVSIVLIMQPLRSRWHRPLVLAMTVLAMLIATQTYDTVEIDVGLHRKISPSQFVANFASIFGQGDNEAGGLEGTKQWRLRWWDDIIDYTFYGAYFWGGKGYGINLATSDGYHVDREQTLRSPHNGHLTILARSGVPGFLLWVGFLLSMALLLIWHGLMNPNVWKRKYAIWLLAYLTAFMIMTAFDVFLEGPMGGIWFWVLVGAALAYFATPDAELADRAHSTSDRVIAEGKTD